MSKKHQNSASTGSTATLPDGVVHTVEIEALRIPPGASFGRFRVWHRGAVLIKRARYPESKARRALAARGLVGCLETRWRGKPGVAMRMDIESVAKLMFGKTGRTGRRRPHGSHASQLGAVHRVDQLSSVPLTV